MLTNVKGMEVGGKSLSLSPPVNINLKGQLGDQSRGIRVSARGVGKKETVIFLAINHSCSWFGDVSKSWGTIAKHAPAVK